MIGWRAFSPLRVHNQAGDAMTTRFRNTWYETLMIYISLHCRILQVWCDEHPMKTRRACDPRLDRDVLAGRPLVGDEAELESQAEPRPFP